MEKESAGFIPIANFAYNLTNVEAAKIIGITQSAITAASYKKTLSFTWGVHRNMHPVYSQNRI